MSSIATYAKSMIAGTALAVATALPMHAQRSSVELVQTKDVETSRVRPHLFYQVPGGIKGYTFMEFYESGDAYFAKTSLTKDIKGGLDAQLQIVSGSGFTDRAGIGLEYTIPTGDKTLAKVKALPVYMGFDGKYVSHKAVLGFYVDQKVYVPLLKDMHVVAFGEIDVAAKGGPKWSYGELHAQKSLDDFVVGLGVDLRSSGKITPDPSVSVKLGYVFGSK